METMRSATEIMSERLTRVQQLMGQHHIHYGPSAVPLDVSIETMKDTYHNGSIYSLVVRRPTRQRLFPNESVFSACIKDTGDLGGSSSGSGDDKAIDALFGWPRSSEQSVDDLLVHLDRQDSSLPTDCQHGPTLRNAFDDLGFLRDLCEAILAPGGQRQTKIKAACDNFEARGTAA